MIETESTTVIAPPGERRGVPQPEDAQARADGAWGVPECDQETIIGPRPGWIAINWKEMWTQRELLMFLVWRDISVRYKQTVLGPAWAIVQPLMTMLIFSFIFGRFVKVPSEGFPYPVFVFAGLIPWTLFSQGMTASALSLVNQQHLLTKVYFPRLFVPIASAGVFLVDLLISLGIYAVILLYYGVAPSWGIIWLPPLILLTFIATLGVGITLAALTVFYRDFKHIVPFLVQILMYVSPVIYPMSMISRRWQLLLSFNPMFGIISSYRSAILGLPWDFWPLAISSTSAVALFIFSIYYFRKTERQFADFA
jgi:lipopolysaccharide transport system permease protein